MSDDFLSRWSRRKLEARRGVAVPEAPVPPVAMPVTAEAAMQEAKAPAENQPLPSLESLTPQSDFTPFMKPEVEGSLRRDALKTLFQDPHFNVMDGLDTYIDDYSKPDPLPDGWLEKMNQVAHLGDWKPPQPPPEAVPGEVPGTPPEGAASDTESPVAADAPEAQVAPPPPMPQGLESQPDTPSTRGL